MPRGYFSNTASVPTGHYNAGGFSNTSSEGMSIGGRTSSGSTSYADTHFYGFGGWSAGPNTIRTHNQRNGLGSVPDCVAYAGRSDNYTVPNPALDLASSDGVTWTQEAVGLTAIGLSPNLIGSPQEFIVPGNTLSISKYASGVWSTHAGHLQSRTYAATAGSPTAVIAIGGIATGWFQPSDDSSEIYDGVSWAYGPDLLQINAGSRACGSSTSLQIVGGSTVMNDIKSYYTASYDGVAWFIPPITPTQSTMVALKGNCTIEGGLFQDRTQLGPMLLQGAPGFDGARISHRVDSSASATVMTVSFSSFNVVAGELLLFILTKEAITATTNTDPAWTLEQSIVSNSNVRTEIWSKVAVGADGLASFTINCATFQRCQASLFALSGVDTSSLQVGTANDGNSASPTSFGISLAKAPVIVLTGYGAVEVEEWFSWPDIGSALQLGLDARETEQTGTYVTMSQLVSSMGVSGTGATGAYTHTIPSAEDWNAFTISVDTLNAESPVLTSLDALFLKQGVLATTALESAIQKQGVRGLTSFTALLNKVGITENAQLDAFLSVSGVDTYEQLCNIDAAIQVSDVTKITSLDAVLRKLREITTVVDVLIKKSTLEATSVDAAIQRVETTASNLDAAIAVSVSIASAVDALLRKAFILNTSADATIRKLDILEISSLDTAIQKLDLTMASTMDAILSKTTTIPLSIDGVVLKSEQLQSSFDALIRVIGGAQFALGSLDAYLQKSDNKTVSLQAMLSRAATSYITLSAAVLKSVGLNLFLDALVYYPGEVNADLIQFTVLIDQSREAMAQVIRSRLIEAGISRASTTSVEITTDDKREIQIHPTGKTKLEL